MACSEYGSLFTGGVGVPQDTGMAHLLLGLPLHFAYPLGVVRAQHLSHAAATDLLEDDVSRHRRSDADGRQP